MKLSKELMTEITSLYKDDGVEIGGYVLTDKVVVCKNEHINPVENFQFTCDDLDKLDENEDKIVALFHTHPNGTSAMSKQDYRAFINWPQFLHLIVGKSGVSCYKVTNKETVVIEDIQNED